MKTAKVKARKMILNNTEECPRVYILPADAASVERMVDQMAVAACKSTFGDFNHPSMIENYQREARAALAAIGIKAKGKK